MPPGYLQRIFSLIVLSGPALVPDGISSCNDFFFKKCMWMASTLIRLGVSILKVA